MLNNTWNGSGGSVLQGKVMDYAKAIMENAPSGVCISDGDGVILCFNQAYERLSGISGDEVLGRNVRELVEERIVSHSGTIKALEQREKVHSKQEFQTGNYVVTTSAPVLDHDEEVVLVVTYAQRSNKVIAYEDQLFGLKQLIQVDCRLEPDEGDTISNSHMTEAMRLAKEAARLDVPVLLNGEVGAGKKRAAASICKNSGRSEERYITIPCGVVPDWKMERELFGEIDNTQSPPQKVRTGLLEMIDKGTVFFDEVGILSPGMQEKLLRVVRDKEICPVGSSEPQKIDVRVLAATSRDLEAMMERRTFSKELYYRLSVFPIAIPPLRYRKEDILPLAEDILRETNRRQGTKKTISKGAAIQLLFHHWPGNVSELRNVVELAAVLCKEDSIQAQDLAIHKAPPPEWSGPEITGEPICLKDILEKLEYEYILTAYEKYRNVRKAAGSLTMDAATYVRKRKKYGQKRQENRLVKDTCA